jgi:hypothetical protein
MSRKALRKRIADRVSRIRLMNNPSTVVIVPRMKVHTIPRRGMRPRMMESKVMSSVSQKPAGLRPAGQPRAAVPTWFLPL